MSKKKTTKRDKVKWIRQYAYRRKSQALKAAKELRGNKGFGLYTYTVRARVRKLPTGMWVVETTFGKDKVQRLKKKR